MKKLSIIVPVWNEEDNIRPLVQRIHETSLKNAFQYEIVFVDDHSTDKTRENIALLEKHYPVTLYLKKGTKGKAHSLLEGFSCAKHEILVMIDADLQYPPEALPEMIEKFENGADIIVANRVKTHTTILRKSASRIFKNVFGKFIHGFDCDVQSGMKLFRKEIIQRLKLEPYAWTFDLELLVKSKQAGYTIDSVDIEFAKRNGGKEKINMFTASSQIVLHALKMKFTPPQIIHGEEGSFHYRGVKFNHYSDLKSEDTAFHRFSRKQIAIMLLATILIICFFILNWTTTLLVFIAALTIIYFAILIFNLYLTYKSLKDQPEINITHKELSMLSDEECPTYTILCPLYREWEVVSQFVSAISKLDYPKDKMEVVLLLEEDDKETQQHIRQMDLPSYVKILVTPHSLPKTKPKACNYALKFIKSEYTVIYDAEDIPDQEQLKKAVLAFKKSPKNVVCIQAKLNFYNPHQNLLTRFFTSEYSLWFDLVLTGLQSINAPIPLGGTSNHFKTSKLKHLNGWDSFNVTEDCDLGLRLAKNGYRTALIDSVTLEEANSDVKNWFNQRTRWIKGYIQSYFVHMRHPRQFMHQGGLSDFIAFQFTVGGKIISMFINPLMWLLTILYFAQRATLGTTIEYFFPAPVLYMGVTCLVFGNFFYLYSYMIACVKREQYTLVIYTLFIPLYWLAMSYAAWRALIQFIQDPHYWPKTVHGLHLTKKTPDKEQGIPFKHTYSYGTVQ